MEVEVKTSTSFSLKEVKYYVHNIRNDKETPQCGC